MLFRKLNYHFSTFVIIRNCSISVKNALENSKFIGQEVRVQGWIRYVRSMKKRYFVHLIDGETDDLLQVLLEKSNIESNPTIGDAVCITGKLVESPKPKQPVELTADKFEILGKMDVDTFPFPPKQLIGPKHLRVQPHLRPKNVNFAALLRFRSGAKRILHDYFESRNYVLIDTPVITRNDCEGAGESFKIQTSNEFASPTTSDQTDEQDQSYHYFDCPAHLTVSGQLHLESIVSALPKVYTFGPIFRAEKSLSRQHLAEFHMLEAEEAFMDSLDSLLDFVENMIIECTEKLKENHYSDFENCAKMFAPDPNAGLLKSLERNQKFPRITYDEALDILEKAGNQNFLIPVSRTTGIAKEHEQYLCKTFDNKPVFVTHFPSEQKPFYMKRNDSGDKSLCFDLFGPTVGEMCGGSVRENDYCKLEARIAQMENETQLDWYLQLRKFGHPPSAGFGLGFERFLQCLLGISNIKDCIPFPRWYKHCLL